MDIPTDIQKVFPMFWNVSISRNGSKYKKTEFDGINSLLLLDKLSEEGSNDDLALVLPFDPTVTALITIESILSLLKYSMLHGNKHLIDSLSNGDSVVLIEQDRRMTPAIFIGVEYKDGNRCYKIKESDGHRWIPESRKWRIQPYFSLETAKRKTRSEIYGKDLELAMKLETGGLLAFQNLKGILVTDNKSRFKEEIKKYSMGNDLIAQVFPIADFTDTDNYKPFINDAIRRDIVLAVVSHTDLAADLALKDEAYKFIIIDGATKIKNSYGSMELLNNDEHPRKIICLLNTSDEEEIKTLHNMKIDQFIWKDFDFNLDNYYLSRPPAKNSDIRWHEDVLKNITTSSKQVVLLPSSNIDQLLRDSLRIINEISSSVPAGDKTSFLLKRLVSMYFFLLHIPVDIKDYEKLRISNSEIQFSQRFSELKADIKQGLGYIFPRNMEPSIIRLEANFEELVKILNENNPRFADVSRHIQTTAGSTIVFAQEDFRDAMNIAMPGNLNDCSLISKNELVIRPERDVFFCGYFARKFIAKTFLAPFEKISFQFYQQENERYESLLKTHPASPQSSLDNKLRDKYSMIRQIKNESNITTQKNEGGLVDIDDFISNFKNKHDLSTDWRLYIESDINQDKMIAANKIIFDSGSFVFADKIHNFNKLDRENNELIKINLPEIGVGDELIFASKSRDLFNDFIDELRKLSKYSSLESVASLWWKSLVEYQHRNHLSLEELSNHLRLVGCKRTLITIRQWVNGETIAPSNLEVSIKSIAKLTNDETLKNSINEIIDSVNALYALHIHAGRTLVKGIINSVTGISGEEIDNETAITINKFAKAAIIQVVENINESEQLVPESLIGRLLEPLEQL